MVVNGHFAESIAVAGHWAPVGLLLTKGQLISECLLGVIDFPQNQQKIWQISALESKK